MWHSGYDTLSTCPIQENVSEWQQQVYCNYNNIDTDIVQLPNEWGQWCWYPLSVADRLSDNHHVGGLRSQMNWTAWKLSFERDEELSRYLYRGIRDGFNILDNNAIIEPYECANYNSVTKGEAYVGINELISKEILEGKYIRADKKPRAIHALGAIKKSDSSFRPITDCKRPLQRSVNNYMETTHQQFSFITIDEVADLIETNDYMCSVDISSAYRSVSINPSDWEYQGIVWERDGMPEYYLDTRLCFGIRCAPYIFTRITSFIVNCMIRRGYKKTVGYIDDFWICESSYQKCKEGQHALITLLGELGFRVNWKKCVSPDKVMTYLGIVFNSQNMSLSLPEEKMRKLRQELEFFREKRRATKRQLQRLCGVLSHASKIVYGGRTFSRRIIELLKSLPEGNVRIKLTGEFREDLAWWSRYAKRFNGVATMVKHHYQSGMEFATDASKKGYGAVMYQDWMAGYFNSETIPLVVEKLDKAHNHWENVEVQDENNINVLELIPVVQMIKRNGINWRNQLVRCHTDNTQVVMAINTGRSSNVSSMSMLRDIFWDSVVHNYHLVASHISGCDNFIPDYLSRWSNDNNISFLNEAQLCCRST